MEDQKNQYDIIITVTALEFIKRTLILPNEESKALVITSAGRIGGFYLITTYTMHKIKSMKFHFELHYPNQKQYGFPIYVEPVVFNGHFLPNPFVIDLVKHYNGELKLDIKNPAFETY